jgi:hypothetical protein
MFGSPRERAKAARFRSATFSLFNSVARFAGLCFPIPVPTWGSRPRRLYAVACSAGWFTHFADQARSSVNIHFQACLKESMAVLNSATNASLRAFSRAIVWSNSALRMVMNSVNLFWNSLILSTGTSST